MYSTWSPLPRSQFSIAPSQPLVNSSAQLMGIISTSARKAATELIRITTTAQMSLEAISCQGRTGRVFIR